MTLSIEYTGPCDPLGRPIVMDGLARGAPKGGKKKSKSDEKAAKFAAKQANTTDKTFEAFLMYSANYDPYTHTPNPPNSAYHMNLQQARFSLSSAFAAKLEEV